MARSHAEGDNITLCDSCGDAIRPKAISRIPHSIGFLDPVEPIGHPALVLWNSDSGPLPVVLRPFLAASVPMLHCKPAVSVQNQRHKFDPSIVWCPVHHRCRHRGGAGFRQVEPAPNGEKSLDHAKADVDSATPGDRERLADSDGVPRPDDPREILRQILRILVSLPIVVPAGPSPWRASRQSRLGDERDISHFLLEKVLQRVVGDPIRDRQEMIWVGHWADWRFRRRHTLELILVDVDQPAVHQVKEPVEIIARQRIEVLVHIYL